MLILLGFFILHFFISDRFEPFQTVSFGVKIGVKIGVKTIKKLGSKISVIYTFGVKSVVRKFELFFSRKSPFFITYNSQITTFYEFLDENANFKGILNYTSIYILNYTLY